MRAITRAIWRGPKVMARIEVGNDDRGYDEGQRPERA